MNTCIPVENNGGLADQAVLLAIRGFLSDLLKYNLVDAIYVPLESNGALIPALITDINLLQQANPLAPVMPINGARAVSMLTGKHPSKRLGVVLRSCEMRALIELVKLQQASLEGVVMIGLDCPGTYEVPRFMEHGGINYDVSECLSAAKEGRDPILEGLLLRTACQMCTQPIPKNADIQLQLFGVDSSRAIPVTIKDEWIVKINESGSISSQGSISWLNPNPDSTNYQEMTHQHQTTADKIISSRQQVRTKELTAIHNQLDSEGGMLELFATCIRCHNCMTACPICYCKTCLFKTLSFDHAPEHYYNSSRHKGAQRMFGDTILFQMTRMNHMSASCVSCGMCTSACPSEIPVGMIFSAVGEAVQSAFEYVPGRDVTEQLPLITFQPNEWTEVGEAK